MLLIPILILSALLRFYNNTALALWHDEAFSALYLRYPWGEMMHRIGLDVHPPLYYWILRVWSYGAGDSLLSLRLLSIIFGVLTVWAGYMFLRAAWGKRVALLGALLLALNPFQIQYALEARMYTLGTFLALWSSYFLVKALESDHVRKKYWAGYALTVAAGLYTHYYLAFTILAQGLFVLIYCFKYRDGKKFFAGVGAYLGATILYLPWVPTFLAQIARVQESYWIPPMDRWSVPGTLWKMIFGGPGIRHSVLLISSVVSVVLLLYVIRRSTNIYKWLVILGVLIPVGAAVGLSMRTDIYLDRYFVFASLFFTILLLLAINSLSNHLFRWVLVIILAGSMGFTFFKNWEKLEIKNKPGMTAASEVINSAAKPGDKIISGSSFIYFTFKYYNETGIPPQLISDRPIKDIPHFSGTAILTDDDLILDLNKFPKGQTVWLLWTTGFGGSKPSLPSNWKQQSETKFADTPGFKGDIYVDQYQISN